MKKSILLLFLSLIHITFNAQIIEKIYYFAEGTKATSYNMPDSGLACAK